MRMSKGEIVVRCHDAIAKYNHKYFKAKDLVKYGIDRPMATRGLGELHSKGIIRRFSSDYGGGTWEWLEWRENAI